MPRVSLVEDDGKLNYHLAYLLPYEIAVSSQEARGLNHFIDGGVEYHLSDATRLFASDDFVYSEAVNNAARTGDDANTDEPFINNRREPILRNVALLGTSHSFNPRLAGEFSLGHDLWRSDISDRSDNQTLRGQGSLNYVLDPRHKVGGGIGASFQDFDESNDGSQAASQTVYANFFASWDFLFDETTRFRIRGGPTFVDYREDTRATLRNRDRIPYVVRDDGTLLVNDDPTSVLCGTLDGEPVTYPDQLNCPTEEITDPADIAEIIGFANMEDLSFVGGVAPDRDETNWTFFGEASLEKRWSRTVATTLSYTRRDDPSSGLSGGSIADLVALIGTWQITELWSLGLRGDWTRRESATTSTQTVAVLTPYTLTGSGLMVGQTTGEALRAARLNRAIDTNRWSVAARVDRQITRQLTSSLRYAFNRQESAGGSLGRESDFDDHLVTFSLQYNFDPIPVW